MKVPLAGGTGYIGSHTARTLLDAGHDVEIVYEPAPSPCR